MNGARIERLGIVRAHDYEGAIYQAMEEFQLEERQQRRLIVWREEPGNLETPPARLRPVRSLTVRLVVGA
jgi:hypothetical protein